MITENINITKLTASEGHYLTNGETYGTVIYLGCNDNFGNWHEITEKEYNEIINAEEERTKLEMGDIE